MTGVAVGDRVYVAALGVKTGTYAERIAVPRRHRAPAAGAAVSFGQGAALGVPAATAYRALVLRAHGARPAKPSSCTAPAAPSALAAVQLARGLGLRVFGTAGSDAGAGCRARRPAPRARSTTRRTATRADITEATGGHGVNVVLEMLANVNLDRDLALLAPKGRVVVIGNRGRIEIDPRQTMGEGDGDDGHDPLVDDARGVPADSRRARRRRWRSGVLRPVVGRELPLEQAAEAHRAILADRAVGKIVLTM